MHGGGGDIGSNNSYKESSGVTFQATTTTTQLDPWNTFVLSLYCPTLTFELQKLHCCCMSLVSLIQNVDDGKIDFILNWNVKKGQFKESVINIELELIESTS